MRFFDKFKKVKSDDRAKAFFSEGDAMSPKSAEAVIADKTRSGRVEFFPGREGLTGKIEEIVDKIDTLYKEIDGLHIDGGLKAYLSNNLIRQIMENGGGVHEPSIPESLRTTYNGLKPLALEIYNLNKEIKKEKDSQD